MSITIPADSTSFYIGARSKFWPDPVSGGGGGSDPVIASVDQGLDDFTLIVNITNATLFNFYNTQIYLDAGLTILFDDRSGSVGFDTTSYADAEGSLSPGTQYWFRVRVSPDLGSTYSGWSNTGTGTTSGVSGLIGTKSFWSDASQITGLTDGATYPIMQDFSGVAGDLIATGATVYRTTAFNGLPSLQFAASSSFGASVLASTLFGGGGTFTLHVAMFKNAGQIGSLFTFNSGGCYATFSDGTLYLDLPAFPDGRLMVPADTTSPCILTIQCNGVARIIRLNGVEIANTTTADFNPSGSVAFAVGLYLQQYNGYLSEFALIKEVLSTGDMSSNEAFLASKWGI